MTTVHKPRLLYDSIKTRLETQKPTEVGKRPDGVSPPYMVIHPTPTRATEGSLTDPDQIRRQTFQVVYVGDDRNEAQWMQEKAQETLLGWSPSVTGFSPGPVELDNENLFSRTDFDGPTHEIADRYLVYVS